ncbi:bifunctional 4-hydroxy-2-oxoglutarate aldolase/2-dehydro-3-deoxy-phosphogluconate aldolase [Glaciihabitans sp. INWT7]|nr:bifunctional 4-hydroxy-2-oxoglutarate aldolase/2-dehydro-3-deoxy-phosphogluconate aldolase [Glaciihabitans sp. INWT7]
MTSVDAAQENCSQLIAAGLSVIELTTTTPGWRELLGTLVSENPTAVIGLGTVTNAENADAACELGASFLVSPYPAPEARRVARDAGRLFVGGGITPAEVAASAAYGLCKLFPAHLGGIAYLKSLTAIMPTAMIMPTGGVRISEVGRWLASGAAAVGLGSDLSSAPDLDAAIGELAVQLKLCPS